jgi:hypothetical protein
VIYIHTPATPIVEDIAFVARSDLRFPLQRDRRLHSAIHDLAKWTHAVTITFIRIGQYGQRCSEYIMHSALRHFIRVLNIKCFGRKQFDKGRRVSVVAAFGMGSSLDHPHGHMAIAAPVDMTFGEFEKLILDAIHKTRWLNQQFDVKPYKNEGWIKYLLDHQEELFMDLPLPAHPNIG